MAQTSPDSRAAQARSHSRVRNLARQLGWASIPVWSATFLARAPFDADWHRIDPDMSGAEVTVWAVLAVGAVVWFCAYLIEKAERKAFRTAAAKARPERLGQKAALKAASRAPAQAARLAAPRYGWVETKRTYRSKTIFGNRRSETVVSLPNQRNARRRTRQRGGVTITEEWRRFD